MHKVPTLANPAKVYIDTNMRLANQVQLCCHKVHCNLLVAKELHLLHAITLKIEGLHTVKCILNSRSQIVSISKAVWRTLNQELNPCWKITMQSTNGLRDESLSLIENLKLEISGMKLHVQAHVIRNPAYPVLLGLTSLPPCTLTTIVTNHKPLPSPIPTPAKWLAYQQSCMNNLASSRCCPKTSTRSLFKYRGFE
jgi:hypothetical protein